MMFIIVFYNNDLNFLKKTVPWLNACKVAYQIVVYVDYFT